MKKSMTSSQGKKLIPIFKTKFVRLTKKKKKPLWEWNGFFLTCIAN